MNCFFLLRADVFFSFCAHVCTQTKPIFHMSEYCSPCSCVLGSIHRWRPAAAAADAAADGRCITPTAAGPSKGTQRKSTALLLNTQSHHAGRFARIKSTERDRQAVLCALLQRLQQQDANNCARRTHLTPHTLHSFSIVRLSTAFLIGSTRAR
jgi:hypothetical protein